MPKLSGLQLAESLRNNGYDIPLVFMSGHIEPGINSSVDKFAPAIQISKPLPELSKLTDILNEVLDKKLL